MEEDSMSDLNRNMRYIGLQQPTSVPSGYQQSAAAPDATSTLAKNSVWPVSTYTSAVVAAPMGGALNPADNIPMSSFQTTASRRAW